MAPCGSIVAVAFGVVVVAPCGSIVAVAFGVVVVAPCGRIVAVAFGVVVVAVLFVTSLAALCNFRCHWLVLWSCAQ